MLIDESEFRQAKVDRSGLKAFSALDSDNNGKIDVAEFELLNR
jgi:Ca2+-binding EF-hand superfamily protein